MDTQLTWYGQSAFKIVTPDGKVLLVDPWLSNPVFDNAKNEIAANAIAMSNVTNL